MNRTEIKDLLPILQAFAEGKTIEMSSLNGWVSQNGLRMELLKSNPRVFRIKPEPKYRPYKDAEECWKEMQKHQPFGWVKHKNKGIRLCIVGLNQKRAFTQVGHNYNEGFDEFTFADGTPFGILEEE